jgi:transposase
MRNYIGIDISKATLDVYDGKKSYKFENNEIGFTKIVGLVEDIKNVIFIFEPTGVYSYALTDFCSKKKYQYCNGWAKRIKRLCKVIKGSF